jgi:hypothetical protein
MEGFAVVVVVSDRLESNERSSRLNEGGCHEANHVSWACQVAPFLKRKEPRELSLKSSNLAFCPHLPVAKRHPQHPTSRQATDQVASTVVMASRHRALWSVAIWP